KCGVLPEHSHRLTLHTKLAIGRCDDGTQIALRHTLLQGRKRCPIRLNGDVVRALHQCEFRGRFDHAAPSSHWIGADELDCGCFLAHAIEGIEWDALFYADTARSNTAIFECLRDFLIGTLSMGP